MENEDIFIISVGIILLFTGVVWIITVNKPKIAIPINPPLIPIQQPIIPQPTPVIPKPSPDITPNLVGPGGEVATNGLYAGNTNNRVLYPYEAMMRLLEGNKRFYSEVMQHKDQTVYSPTSSSQTPYVCILTCSDSRVSPEIIFDEGIGNIFVVRNAGNVLDDHTIGSIEYAIQQFKVPLLIVMSHTKCDIVEAVVDNKQVEGKFSSIATSLQEALDRANETTGSDIVDKTAKINAKLIAYNLYNLQPIIAPSAQSGQIKIYAACYDVSTGRVEILDGSSI